jgi:hypothetical protein
MMSEKIVNTVGLPVVTTSEGLMGVNTSDISHGEVRR